MHVKRRFRLPALSTWDVSVFFWILGIVLGTIAAVCFQISSGSGHAGLESVLAARLGQEIGDLSGAGGHLNAGMKAASRGTLFFQVWLQRSGMALMLWLAGMTPVACLAAWGACLVLGLEQAWLLAGFTGWGGFWGLPVFVATLFPQVVFYIPVFWLLLSWALAKERRIRTAGFLILLLVLGMGTALEVWLNPGFVSLLVSRCPF